MKPTLTRAAIAGSTALFALTVAPTVAHAQTIDDGCGTTITTSCTSTIHYTDNDQWLGGGPTSPNCPDYINNDWGHETGTGKGVSHVNINKDGDEWLTNTWNGDASITFYAPGNIDVVTDSDGNVVSATPTGPPEEVVTGHNTSWFGASFNNRSSEFSFTFSFEGTDQEGRTVRVHGDQHAGWTPGTDPFGPPTHMHANFSCS